MNAGQLLLEVLLKATVVLATAGLLNVVLRRASATTRHLVWSLALAALLVLPLLTLLLPAWRVPVLPARQLTPQPKVVSTIVAEAEDEEPVLALPATISVAVPLPVEVAATPTAPVSQSVNWLAVALSVWAAGALVVLARLLLGTWKMRRITREAECLTDYHWSAMTTRLRTQLDLPAHISLYGSDAMQMAVTWGIWRPVVLLPADAAQWSSDWRRIVLLHELAHIKRRDCLTQMLANWACALFWFHPLAWYAARQMRIERELACDDYVLEVGTRASDYAGYLVELAQAFESVEPASPVAVGMACSQLESRVRAILNPARKRSVPTMRRWLAWTMVTAFVIAPLASLQATAPEPIIAAAVLVEEDEASLASEMQAELKAKVAEWKQQQCKLDDLRAKAKRQPLSEEEESELESVQDDIASLRADLQDTLASNLSHVEVASPVALPSPEPAPATASKLNVIQPEPYPAPLKIRSGRLAADLTPELALAIAAMQDSKQKEEKEREQALSADSLIRLKIAGVTPEYIEAMKRAGLDDLSVRQICELKMHDVTPEFIKQAQSWSTEKLSTRDIVNLKISGLTPEYMNAIKQAGFDNLSVRKLSQMRLMGVTPEYIAAMKRTGFDNLTADQVTQLKTHNVTEEYIKQAQSWGLGKLSVRDVLQIKIHGVKPEDAQAWKALGFDHLTLRDLTNIRIHNVSAEFIKQMRDLGFDKLSLEQLLKLKIHDVSPEYIRKMRAAGFKSISANDLVRMKIQGIDTILLKGER